MLIWIGFVVLHLSSEVVSVYPVVLLRLYFHFHRLVRKHQECMVVISSFLK